MIVSERIKAACSILQPGLAGAAVIGKLHDLGTALESELEDRGRGLKPASAWPKGRVG